MAVAKKNEPNEYEAERADKIAKNQALLKELQLNAAAAEVGRRGASRSSKAPKSSSGNKKKRPVKKEAQDITPRRTSSRLAGIQADSEVAKRKAEDDYVAIKEAERAKRQRISADLDLKDAVVVGKDWDRNGNFLANIVSRGNNYERTFTERDVKETGDQDLKALRERISGLDLYEGFEPNRIKITPERIYSMGFHPIPEKPVVLAGDKLGNLGIFDASQQPSPVKAEDDEEEEDEPDPAITTFKLHTRTISTFAFPPSNASTLLSASYDSSIRSLDMAASKSTEVYAPASTDDDEPISGLEVPYDSPHTLYFSTLHGAFGRHDMRAPTDNTGGTENYLLSEKKIGGFTIHPRQPHFVATASLDRTLKIWDMRKISGKGDMRQPALLGEHQSPLSVSHASWNAAGQVATASYDNTVKIHDFGDCAGWRPGHDIGEEGMEPATVVRHDNQTGRWVTILRAQWQQSPSDGIQKFCIGNMKRFVDVYTSKGEQVAQLGGESITAVPAVAQFHPTMDWICGGTASGKLCLWM